MHLVSTNTTQSGSHLGSNHPSLQLHFAVSDQMHSPPSYTFAPLYSPPQPPLQKKGTGTSSVVTLVLLMLYFVPLTSISYEGLRTCTGFVTGDGAYDIVESLYRTSVKLLLFRMLSVVTE